MTVTYNEARKRWQYDFKRNGKRFAGYCLELDGSLVASRRGALDAEARLKAQVQSGSIAPPVVAGYTLAEAVADWAENVGQHNRSWSDARAKLRELLAFFGAGTACVDIGEARIDEYIAWARAQHVGKYTGGPRAGGKRVALDRLRTPATVNRHLDALRAVLRRAHRLRLTPSLSTVPRLREKLAAPNPIRRQDMARLIDESPPHVRRVLVLCAHTGMRLQECLGLSWGQVDLERRVISLGTNTKSGKGRTIPLNAVAIAELEAAAAEPLHESGRVILYRGRGSGRPRPVASIQRAWAATLARCGLPKRYRFHDSRAAFCTYLAEQGVDVAHVQALAGHASISTTLRYIRPTEARLRQAVDGLAAG
jgi:integrase